jgi:acyl carrier protein phosphodiesterase
VNHLAHSWLAGARAEHVIGALLGDVVRGRLQAWPRALGDGVRLHRRIDAYTDAHPAVLAARARFAPPFRRYAGVLLDLWFDHLLARDFERLTGAALRAFAARVYAIWRAAPRELPASFHLMAARLIEHDALVAYADPAHVERVLERVAARLARPSPVADALPLLQALQAPLALCFERLWPELVAHAERARIALDAAPGAS